MCGKYNRYPVGHLVNFIDKNRAFFFQCGDNLSVMHYLMAHIYRRAMQIEGAFDNLDRAVNPRAEPAWICQDEGF